MNTTGKSILIVEDDLKIRQLVRIYLENAGFEVWEAGDGEEALQAFQKKDPCFAILDIMLPKRSGWDVCHTIRNEWKSDIPIIMLTAMIGEQDRIKGLQSGADDYVTKPFSPQELVVRVETVLRRTANRCSKITYRGLTVKPIKGEVHLNGGPLSLTQQEFKLLYIFMRHPNQILTREQLLAHLYPLDEKMVTERNVDVHIKNLRQKLENDLNENPYIETIRGMGYRFVAF